MKLYSTYFNLFAALTMGCVFVWGCENDATKVNRLNKKNTGVEEAIAVRLNYTIGGKTKAILTSPLMLNVQATVPYVEFPKTLHVDFYNDSTHEIESVMDARYANYKQYQSIVYLRDSVVVRNIQKGDTLYCDELYWDRNRTGVEFYTDKPVKIRTKTETLDGKGMEAGQDFRNWHIMHPVGPISIPASKFPG